MNDPTRREIWILGATGRTGRAIATRLAENGESLVLVGRSRAALDEVANALPGRAEVLVAGGPSEMIGEIGSARPAVVVNTLGGYARTATDVARACIRRGTHYLDLANDLVAIPALLELHGEAAASGCTLVTGAGFGVLATESVVAALCADAPRPSSVRVDALASFASEDGAMGEAFAGTVVEVLTTGGREFRNGTLVRTRLGDHPQRLDLPDGSSVPSAAVPSGELLAARSASGADDVVFTSALAPSGAAARAMLPVAGMLLSRPVLARLAVRGLARVRTKAAPRPRAHSWGHAVVEWPDDNRRQGWLRADDAMDYTAGVAAAAAERLARDDGPAGAYTPAAAFGPQLAVDAGGTLLLD